MNESILLSAAAGSIAFVHTLAGPDHYVPFVAMARARKWSVRRTLVVTTACGVGHVLGSIAIGTIGLAAGAALGQLEWIESWRGGLAGWALIAFGLVYLVVGVKRGMRKTPHAHLHVHADGTVHCHEHTHDPEHLHLHSDETTSRKGLIASALFVIFVLGPCEPLIPLLIVPGLEQSLPASLAICGAYLVTTVATMVICVAALGAMTASAGHRVGQSFAPLSHAWGGLAILSCGILMKLGL
ncbi:MAG: hypothetical protein AAGF97_12040 [Planctomycetota bacterium]